MNDNQTPPLTARDHAEKKAEPCFDLKDPQQIVSWAISKWFSTCDMIFLDDAFTSPSERVWVKRIEVLRGILEAEISTALTRSEEEKKIASDALAMVSEDAGELQVKLRAAEEEKNALEGKRSIGKLIGTMGEEDEKKLLDCIRGDAPQKHLILSLLYDLDLLPEQIRVKSDSSWWRMLTAISHMSQLGDDLSTLTARLKEAENAIRCLLKSADASWAGGHDWKESVRAAESFLTASTPVEKKA
jgi:hypothetical protein